MPPPHPPYPLNKQDEDEDESQHTILLLLALVASQSLRTARHSLGISRLKGQHYVKELLSCNSNPRIYRVLRMSLSSFYDLRDWILENTKVRDSKTQQVHLEEKLVIFLYSVNNKSSNRMVQETFGHSGETISRVFYEILDALVLLYKEVVRLPTEDTPLGSRIADYPEYFPYFKDCLGALDSTHVLIHVPDEDKPRYRNRKKELSQNVLAVCNFDMVFTFILSGWEGSAHDAAVLRSAKALHGFTTPEGKYWLGDAGYAKSDTILSLYRATRYHLKEQARAKLKPKNAKELFNLRHAALRNVVERIFGVLRRKYHILWGSEFPVTTQVLIVIALTTLHNFVRLREGIEADILLTQEVDNPEVEDTITPSTVPVDSKPSKKMDRLRDEMAEKMWVDYKAYCIKHSIPLD